MKAEETLTGEVEFPLHHLSMSMFTVLQPMNVVVAVLKLKTLHIK